tara:strand:- start:87 stop:311 length:225 start_codon:yes stop_codon:yes gene_type:complete
MTFEQEIEKYESEKIKAIQDNVLDLFWEYDRMSSCGQKSLDALARLTGVPMALLGTSTEREIMKRLKQYHKDTA